MIVIVFDKIGMLIEGKLFVMVFDVVGVLCDEVFVFVVVV